MKCIKATLVTILISISACAQNTPEIPTPPQAPSSGNSHTEVTTSSSARISSSTSVSDSKKQYKFRSKFHSSKKEGVKNILTDALDNIKVKKNRRELLWEIVENGEVIFECTLSKNRLSIYLDKKATNSSFYRKIKSTGEDLQEFISSHKRHTFQSRRENSIGRAEARLERAKRELEASIKNLKEIKREKEEESDERY
ncbi:hypothetical protein [uncultured Tenacibaculum sp.]|uniref:hypothetical protein n=1 Tax=uncultured Tenacibaculum sp. TaxID=174713 RepID=UPI00262CBB1A|nr:hypothetical protein [uncultured Tenacibaculum sp.]